MHRQGYSNRAAARSAVRNATVRRSLARGRVPDGAPKIALRKRKAIFIMIGALCECFRFAADFNPSQRLFLFCRRNSRTFSVRETVAYMQLPIKVSSKIIS